MSIRLIAAAFAISAGALPAIAHHDDNHGVEVETASIGPVIGALAPTVTAVTADGSPASLAAISGSSGVIVAFVRSADWCPFCKKQLIELNEAETDIWANGWQVVGLSYDAPEKLAEFKGKSNITFPLFSDADSTTIKAFGLLNEEVDADSRSYGIPHPALVFIGNDGTVRAVLREESFRTRPSIDLINETIETLDSAQ